VKKLFVLLLLLLSVLALFAACAGAEALPPSDSTALPLPPPSANDGSGPEMTAEGAVGLWIFQSNLSDFAATEGVEKTLVGYFQFREDRTATIYFRKEEVVPILEALYRYTVTPEKTAETMGITVEQLHKSFAALGTSWEEYQAGVIKTSTELLFRVGPFSNVDGEGRIIMGDGYYKVENGKLYFARTPSFTEEDGEPFTYRNGVFSVRVRDMEMDLTRK